MAMPTMATPRMAILYTYGFTHYSQVVCVQYGYTHYGHTHYGFTYYGFTYYGVTYHGYTHYTQVQVSVCSLWLYSL